MSRRLVIALAGGAALLLGVVFLRSSGSASAVLWQLSGQGRVLLPLLAATALVDSINPCAFSVLLLTIAFLISIGRLRRQVLTIGISYTVGLFLAYLAIGLGLLGTLHLFGTPHFMGRLGAILLVGLGVVNVVNELWPDFPVKLKMPSVAHHRLAKLIEQASLPTAFLLGGLVGVCEFPCTGGPYLTAVGLLHDRVTYLTGVGYLILYNLIFILPLLVILGLASDPRLTAAVERWQKSERPLMRLVLGGAMVVLGLLILFI